MKKGQIYEGIIERVDFPNKGIVFVPEEEQYVTVKNGIPGQKIRFMINKFKRGNAEGRLLEVLEKSPLETREPVSDDAIRRTGEDERRADPQDYGSGSKGRICF